MLSLILLLPLVYPQTPIHMPLVGTSILTVGYDAAKDKYTSNLFQNSPSANMSENGNYSVNGVFYIIPPHVQLDDDAAPFETESTLDSVFNTTTELASYRADSIGIDASFYANFSAHVAWTSKTRTAFGRSQAMVLHTRTVFFYYVALQDVLPEKRTKRFQEQVDLLNASDPRTFDQLVETFGTHYVHRAFVGGQLEQTLIVAKCFFEKESTTTLTHVVQLAADAGGLQGLANAAKDGAGKEVPNDAEVDIKFNGTSVSVSKPAAKALTKSVFNVVHSGGDASLSDDSDWAKSVPNNPPAVYRHEVRPIDLLFVGEHRLAVRAAVERYMTKATQNASTPMPLDDADIQDCQIANFTAAADAPHAGAVWATTLLLAVLTTTLE